MSQAARNQARVQVANALPTVAAGAAMSQAARNQARVRVANAMPMAAAGAAMRWGAGSSALVQVVCAQSMVAVSAPIPQQGPVGQLLGYLALMQMVYPSPQYDIQSRALRTRTRTGISKKPNDTKAGAAGRRKMYAHAVNASRNL